ncbi:ATPase AAA [Dyella jiangningensis]|nr:ATPase AAA [Dyella jiangningensis]
MHIDAQGIVFFLTGITCLIPASHVRWVRLWGVAIALVGAIDLATHHPIGIAGAVVGSGLMVIRRWRLADLQTYHGLVVIVEALASGLALNVLVDGANAIAHGNFFPQIMFAAGSGVVALATGWDADRRTKSYRARVNQSAGAPPATPPAGQPASNEVAQRYQAVTPHLSFAQIHGQDELKAKLIEAGQAWRHGEARMEKHEAKNGVLLFGPPGTGKTTFGEALAGELGVNYLYVTFGDLASKWINQTTEQVVALFQAATAQQPCVLFIDELDSVVKDRSQASGGNEENDRIVTTFLDWAVRLRGSQVLLVSATNHFDKLDKAAIREGRFDFKIEVGLPDAGAREGLIRGALAKAGAHTDAETLARLVRRWAGFNVPRLMDAAREGAHVARMRSAVTVTYADFYQGLRKIQGGKGGAPEGAKGLDDLYLDADLKQRVAQFAAQLVRVDELEAAGGNIPKGLLFLGPPGTGKTTTAMALAKACGWTFIERTGRDLMQAGATDKLRSEASDLRPAIVFIDEADDILADRAYSQYKAVTNELLTLMDGAGGMLHDVVWIAATNSADAIDEAARRGGRFTQKIEFRNPGDEVMLRLVQDWATRHAAYIAGKSPATWASQVMPFLSGTSPANAFATLEAANSTAAIDSVTNGIERAVTLRHIEAAAAEVLKHA